MLWSTSLPHQLTWSLLSTHQPYCQRRLELPPGCSGLHLHHSCNYHVLHKESITWRGFSSKTRFTTSAIHQLANREYHCSECPLLCTQVQRYLAGHSRYNRRLKGTPGNAVKPTDSVARTCSPGSMQAPRNPAGAGLSP